MKNIIFLLLIILPNLVVSGQKSRTILKKEVGNYKFKVLQTKTSKLVVCHQNGDSNVVWQESRLITVDSILEINMYDSIFVMVYTTPNAYHFVAIAWDGKSWRTKIDRNLPSYDNGKITEVRLLDANNVSVNTKTDSTIYRFDLKSDNRDERKVISFRKVSGTHKYEVRNVRDSSYIIYYHDGKVDTLTYGKLFYFKVKDICVFGDKFVMVYEDDFMAYFLSRVWNGKKWKVNYVGKLYDIRTSGEPPTTLAILDENTVRYQRRGETILAKIDYPNKKITQTKE